MADDPGALVYDMVLADLAAIRIRDGIEAVLAGELGPLGLGPVFEDSFAAIVLLTAFSMRIILPGVEFLMNARRRAVLAALLSVLIALDVPAPAPTSGQTSGIWSPAPVMAQATASHPLPRVSSAPLVLRAVKQAGTPVGARPPDPKTIRPVVTTNVRRTSGVKVAGPRMLSEHEIDTPIGAARARALQSAAVRPSNASTREVIHTGGRRQPDSIRRAASLGGSTYGAGTGINPWWHFTEQDVPGGGHVMANVGTGNVVLDEDDMAVPHKGIALAYRRTYNSQSGHDVNGSDGSWPTLQGNGWTTNWDAHLSGDPAHAMTVWDIDGARYDYTLASDGATWTSLTPGQHATLAPDGGCGVLWTNKSGTTYYFYALNGTSTCSNSVSLYGGYSGRLYSIFGRNRNTWIHINYYWENGFAGSTGKLTNLAALSESGLQAVVAMSDFNGHRLASGLTRPDGSVVSYQYDSNGNLTSVGAPSNSSSASAIWHTFGYGASANGASYLEWAASPRWANSAATDGSYVYFGVQPTGNTVSLSSIGHVGFINPSINDGVSAGPLQSAMATGIVQFLFETYVTNTPTPSLSDTDGHLTNWTVDGSGRPLQTQECTASQGQQCAGIWLTSTEAWDANNNLIATIEPRGNAPGVAPQTYETDYAYDGNGNVTQVAYPSVPIVTSAGQATIRPTKMFDYDAYNNLLAYCDESQTHAGGGDWTGAPSTYGCGYRAASESHLYATYAYPSYEPYGELISLADDVLPNTYKKSFTYDASRQGGADYGLVTSVTSTDVGQIDGSAPPRVDVWYDSSGNPGCFANGLGTAILLYDAMGRPTTMTDPDDSTEIGICAKAGGQPSWNTATTAAYYSDGSLRSTQTPSERTAGVSTSFAYDVDGNLLSQDSHNGCTSSSNCNAGITHYWYDGAGRLVETSFPTDTSNSSDIPWLERNIYDLTSGGSAHSISGVSVIAHGNLYETQKSTSVGWVDTAIVAYDALNRDTSDYAFAPCPSGATAGAVYCSQTPYSIRLAWDVGPSLGLLASVTDGLGATRSYAYDSNGQATAIQYTGDGGVTPAMSFAYDPSGRVVRSTAGSVGTETYGYDLAGKLLYAQEPSSIGSGQLQYQYYNNGALRGVSISSPGLTKANLFQYAYRADGLISHESFGLGGAQVGYTYTPGGRLTLATDSTFAQAQILSYDGSGRMSSYTIPAGAYSALTYDAEGNLTGYSAYNGESIAMTYDVRGNLVGQSFSPNSIVNGVSSWPAFQYSNVQGVTVQSSSEQWDGRTGAVLSLGNGPFTYDAIGRLSQVGSGGVFAQHFSYDAEDRLTRGDIDRVSGSGNCGSGKRYIQGGQSAGGNLSYTYGPDGQVAQDTYTSSDGSTNSRQWHWNGGTLIDTVTNGTLDAVSADGLGVIPPNGVAPGLTFSDKDLNGYESSRHNGTGVGSWSAPNPFGQRCVAQQPVPPSVGYVDPITAVTTTVDGQVDDSYNTIYPSGRARLPAAISRLALGFKRLISNSGDCFQYGFTGSRDEGTETPIPGEVDCSGSSGIVPGIGALAPGPQAGGGGANGGGGGSGGGGNLSQIGKTYSKPVLAPLMAGLWLYYAVDRCGKGYVGLTCDINRRTRYWARKNRTVVDRFPLSTSSRPLGRANEQAYINKLGTKEPNGLNKINSVSPNNPLADFVKAIEEALTSHGKGPRRRGGRR